MFRWVSRPSTPKLFSSLPKNRGSRENTPRRVKAVWKERDEESQASGANDVEVSEDSWGLRGGQEGEGQGGQWVGAAVRPREASVCFCLRPSFKPRRSWRKAARLLGAFFTHFSGVTSEDDTAALEENSEVSASPVAFPKLPA